MDSSSLQNASTYLNNLLLARGLLRNGKSIEFACPKRGAGGTDDTLAKIINLVHDLVIRRDRDAEQRESLATNIRKLRAEDAQRASEVERLQSKNVELMRSMALSEGQQRSLEASARKAESSARELREQMAKMKSTLDQVRAKCVNDIRKRDIELEKLKKHVTGMQRGATQVSGMRIVQLNAQPPMPKTAREFRSGVPVNDENWSLDKETNDFLAALVNETSTENVALRHVVRDATDALKELTGLDEAPARSSVDHEIGIPGQYKQSRLKEQSAETSLVSSEDLAEEMDVVLGHCRAILKDPSFVSIEEVQIREDEIIKLREGWEKMASRWRDAVGMMDTWRKRMLEGGNAVDLDELSNLGFGKSMATMPGVPAAIDADESTAAMSDDRPETVGDETDKVIDQGAEDLQHEPGGEDAPASVPTKRLAASPARRGVQLPRPVITFEEIDGSERCKPPESDQSSLTTSTGDSGIGSLDGSVDSGVSGGKSPCETPIERSKRTSPSLSIAQKLAIIEAEAKEAEDTRPQQESHKRKASRSWRPKKASRRRSTLSPEELAQLMGVR